MKKIPVWILSILFCCICFNSVNAQVLKYKAKQTSLKLEKSPEEREWIACDVLVVIDTAESIVTIYKEPKERYDIVKALDYRKESNHLTIAFKAVDTYGKEIIISLSVVKDKDYNALLIIAYKEYNIAYKLYDL